MQNPKLVHVMADAMSLLFLKGQITFMKEKGYQITAVTTPSKTLNETAVAENIETFGVDIVRKISPLTDCKAIFRLYRYFKKLKPNIVHAHTPKGGLIGILSATLARIPIRIYHMRGLPLMTAKGLTRKLLWLAEKTCCTFAHEVICVSHSLKAVAIAEKLVQPHKITVVEKGSGNGVDAIECYNPDKLDKNTVDSLKTSLELPNDALVLGFIGRLVQDKGIRELIALFQKIVSSYPSLYLILVGPKEERDAPSSAIMRYIETHPNIRYVGSQKILAPYYALFDVVVFPSYREGFPNVPLEAAAMQIPVVASKIPGCVDVIVPNETGALFDVSDLIALEQAVCAYLSNAHLRQEHGKQARKHILNHFLPQRIWQGYAQIYHHHLHVKKNV